MVALSVGVIGVSYGVTAQSAGLPLWQILALAICVFGASSEFLFVGVLATGGSAVFAVLAGLLVNLRNAAYGLTAGGFLGRGWRAVLGAHLVNDETVAMASARPSGAQRRLTFWISGVALLICWPLGALAGALLGQVVQDPETLGLDAAFPAVILAVVLPSLRDTRVIVAALAAALVAVGSAPWVPAGAAPVVALVALAVFPPRRHSPRRFPPRRHTPNRSSAHAHPDPTSVHPDSVPARSEDGADR